MLDLTPRDRQDEIVVPGRSHLLVDVDHDERVVQFHPTAVDLVAAGSVGVDPVHDVAVDVPGVERSGGPEGGDARVKSHRQQHEHTDDDRRTRRHDCPSFACCGRTTKVTCPRRATGFQSTRQYFAPPATAGQVDRLVRRRRDEIISIHALFITVCPNRRSFSEKRSKSHCNFSAIADYGSLCFIGDQCLVNIGSK